MKRAVAVEVEGAAGHRMTVRCKLCRARWTQDVLAAAWERYRFQPNEPSVLGLSHSCPKFDDWKARHPLDVVLRSALVVDLVRWAPKPGGRLTECGGRCLHAKGGDCDCKCGGVNHGRGSAAVVDLGDLNA